MRISRALMGRVAMVAVPLAISTAMVVAAPSTTLRDNPGVSATMEIADGTCPATIPITVRASNADDLKHGSKALLRVMAWAQVNVQMTCPQASAIQLTGILNGEGVYKGGAQRSDGWALVEAAIASKLQAAQPDVQIATTTPPPAPMTPLPANGATGVQPAAPIATALAITPCDKFGGHPDDPESVTAGISDEMLDAKAVISACETSIKADPAIPRQHFQLARGYLKANRIEDTVEQLLLAAQEGHGGALAHLGDLHLSGVPGIEADPMLARSLYERAVASGFEPAKRVLAEFEDKTEELERAEREEAEEMNSAKSSVSSGKLNTYSYPQVIENIAKRQFDNIENNERWVKSYLYNIADNIRAVCETHFTQNEVNRFKAEAERDHFNIGQAAVGATILGQMTMYAEMLRNPGAFVQEAQASSADNDPFDVALKDTSALFQRHMCKTPGLSQFSNNLKAYVMNEEAPLPAPDAIMNACLRNPLSSKYKPSDFCACFVGGLANARVSQANRRDLSTQFNATAQKLVSIDKNRVVFRACQSGY